MIQRSASPKPRGSARGPPRTRQKHCKPVQCFSGTSSEPSGSPPNLPGRLPGAPDRPAELSLTQNFVANSPDFHGPYLNLGVCSVVE